MVKVSDSIVLTDEQINAKYNLKQKDMKNLKIEKTVYPDGLEQRVEKLNTVEEIDQFLKEHSYFTMTKKERNLFLGAIVGGIFLFISLMLIFG